MIAHFANLRNVIFTGSFADFNHYKSFGYEPISPKDIDIIITDLRDLGGLQYKAELKGPFTSPVYDKIIPHVQYFINFLGVKIDIYVVKDLDIFNSVETSYINFYGSNLQIRSIESSKRLHEASLVLFGEDSKNYDIYRLRKHSRRLAFFKMLEKGIL